MKWNWFSDEEATNLSVGAGKGTQFFRAGSGCHSLAKEGNCKICNATDHWKGECRMKGIKCRYCGGEHMNKLCSWQYGTPKDGRGKGKGGDNNAVKSAGKTGKGEGKPPRTKILCLNTWCGHMNPGGTAYCEKCGTGTYYDAVAMTCSNCPAGRFSTSILPS